jgi:hypothetical protein
MSKASLTISRASSTTSPDTIYFQLSDANRRTGESEEPFCTARLAGVMVFTSSCHPVDKVTMLDSRHRPLPKDSPPAHIAGMLMHPDTARALQEAT